MSGERRPATAVICDFGGVLTTPLIRAMSAYTERAGITLADLGEALVRAAEADGGRHPLFELECGCISEEEFVRRVETQLPEGASLEGYREVWFDHLDPNRPMIDFMGRLRREGLRMALLTNNVREWEPLWRAKLPELDEIFELVVDSAFVGMRKPDPEIYELTLERMGDGVRAEDCVFIDDTAPNCDTARGLGMYAVHFEDTERAIREVEAALGRSA